MRDPALATVPKALWCDEGWRFGGSLMADLIRTATKTWRKHNAWVVFATQDEIDMRNSGLLEVLNAGTTPRSSCRTRARTSRSWVPRSNSRNGNSSYCREMKTGEMLVKTPQDSRRLRLRLSPARLEEYSNQFAADPLAELQEA